MIEKIEGEGGLKCFGYEVPRDGVLRRVTRLNVGCGLTRYMDCCNVDISTEVDADVVMDITQFPWPFQADTFSSVYCSHVLEHIREPLPFMQELARVCCPGAVAVFKLPYGSSDNAWEDPTHYRPYFLDSFGYFSQAAYGGADYGYKGDWSGVTRELRLFPDKGFEQLKDRLEELLGIVMTMRNVVEEYKVVMRNIKPPRSPAVARESCPITFAFSPSKQSIDDPAANEKERPS